MSRGRLVRWIAHAAPAIVLGLLAAAGTMMWEEGYVSPADGDSQARLYFLFATTIWALILAFSAHLRLRRLSQVTDAARGWTPSGLLVVVATGAVLGAGLFAAVDS